MRKAHYTVDSRAPLETINLTDKLLDKANFTFLVKFVESLFFTYSDFAATY